MYETSITIWEGAPQWGNDVSDDERDALNAGYEQECERRLMSCFPGARIDHVIDYTADGDRKVRGTDADYVHYILDGIYEEMCAEGVL